MQHPATAIAPFPLAFGVGTKWFVADREGVDRGIVDGIKTALETGYRHIDSAQMYNNEPEFGIALEESHVERSEIFITSKTLDLDDPENALKTTLAKVKTSYVDMYLIHAPFFATSSSQLQEAWIKMEACVRRGLARNIGVSSFTKEHIDLILDIATIPISVVQVEMHPWLQQSELRAYLREKEIPLETFGCLAPLTHNQPFINDALWQSMSKKYNASPSTILLKWAMQQGSRVVTTSSRRDRLLLYLEELPAFELSQSDINAISTIHSDKQVRNFFGDEFRALTTPKHQLEVPVAI